MVVVDARIWTHSQWEGGAMALVEEERSAAVSEVNFVAGTEEFEVQKKRLECGTSQESAKGRRIYVPQEERSAL
ncbi:predicted protein [Sclerotinia sclerotiorum 1980 UF-70]|uniref:Uncharacterized protein n=1 Tax=Sclerotinia sclerotiorum (strain ATCC 18683 / 1980 / Ss-1) TaxID=665079 RepID=A7EGT4_SCLS1|nr:predicted protein [Sclerotinia sclerotiorum 1980 UF-70]EDO02050.1 predicted protein [Sclerotinia sclerotiorum 1980 UF-70]